MLNLDGGIAENSKFEVILSLSLANGGAEASPLSRIPAINPHGHGRPPHAPERGPHAK